MLLSRIKPFLPKSHHARGLNVITGPKKHDIPKGVSVQSDFFIFQTLHHML